VTQLVTTPHHTISIVVDGQQVRGVQSYEINVSMLTPCDHFTLRIPFSRPVWDLCKPDKAVKVLIDEVVIINGRIDDRTRPEDGYVVQLTGRDSYARVYDESAPSINFEGLDIYALITQMAKPWFSKVTFSNARNRIVVRGRGRKAKAAAEPAKLQTSKKIGTHIEPGQTRATVIASLCEQGGLLAWSSADGTELVVGRPNYDQEVQFRLFHPDRNSKRAHEATVRAMGIHDSVGERYSRVIVVGSGTGTAANYGAAVASRYGESKDNPGTPEGDGLDFDAPKRLIVQRTVNSAAEAQELADLERARRDAHGEKITARAAGHGQIYAGAFVTIFAPDLMASVEDEATGREGSYLITSCAYRSDRPGGEETSLELVPRGAVLVVESER
jgi:prophage tail gpP-like protein